MFAKTCDRCRAIRACKYTFRKYWEDKSSNGVGCMTPIDDDWAKRVIEVVYGIRYVKPKAAKQETLGI